MRLIPTLLALALLVSGCTPARTDLRTTCDQLAVAMKDLGPDAPDRARYAAVLPELQALSDAGDDASRAALVQLLAAVKSGADGDSAALLAIAAAAAPLLATCGAAGSTAFASAPGGASPTAAASVDQTECSLVAVGVVAKVLGDSGRTATASASVRSGRGAWLVALRLRSGEEGAWLVDSITDATSVQAVSGVATSVGGWPPASESYDAAAVGKATACLAAALSTRPPAR